MPIGPTTHFGKERVFVDREPCIQAFRETIQNSGNREYNVLFYYGIAGIGKSKLQKELQKILDEEYSEILWAAIDLNTKTYREVGTFLTTLRNKIQEKYKAKFYLFNIAHAIYWKKLHPEIPLLIENYPLIKEGKFFSKIIEVLNEFGPARLIWDTINNAPDNVMRCFKEHAVDINILTAMEAPEIEKLLPGFFAADFTDYLGTGSRAYIFIDTYEALWDGLRDKGSFHEKDEWIRDNLIQNMPRVSWVICGREKLLWVPECDPDWDIYLEQHSVDELPESYCTEFLEDCGIENKEIRDIIIKSSEGVPYYLNLSIDTFEKIYKKRQPVSKDFGKTQPEVFNRFVKYLDRNEIRALEVLSTPNFWNRDLFELLMKKFDPGLPTGAFSELIKFSFIKTDSNDKYSIHQLMRKSLQEHQDSTDRKNTHQFLLAYYSDKIEDLDIKAITPEHELALTEAFYHAKEAFEEEDLFKWFIYVSDPFNRAALWQLIAPMYEEMLQILEAKCGPEHKEIVTILNILDVFYHKMGEYKKALPLCQKALTIGETILDPQHPDVATSLDNLALLYKNMGEYKKALQLSERALKIYEKVLDPQHPDVAITLDNLAGLYESMGEYKKALTFYQRTIEIKEKVLGPQHPDFATSLDNLALLYRQMGEYEKALQLSQRALEIYEKVLGPQHPDIATTLNNIALIYDGMGDYQKTLPLYQRALEINEKVFGPQYSGIATTLNNLAGFYRHIGDYEKALSLSQRSLEIYEKVLGPQHPDVARTLNSLALLYESMGDQEKALTFYQRSLDIREKVLGPQHPDVARTLNNLAGLYEIMGDQEKALTLYQRTIEIKEKALGPQHPDVATILNNLAGLNYRIGEYKKALPLYQRALDIVEKNGQNHPNTVVIKNNYNRLLSKINENAEK
ncbi:MAG: tetratricopeptide repeat protein [Methanosarcina sp.]|uniref:tetratricopeptide repeat protein n=1 Tax=Methanosarcina sp. TaxID=2213 RepID=UPI002613B3BA|nr:tetratricopeptide repeat protein [Methanosarcina sp.]MDD3245455.1 tetratricopeptide repeat protein [Methanosarcina sp.]